MKGFVVVTTAAVAVAAVLITAIRRKQAGAGYDLGSGDMFDVIAPKYDLINRVMSCGLDMSWRRAMIDSLQLRVGDRVVDLATGTADVAIMVAKDLALLENAGNLEGEREGIPPVVGIDPSAKMIEIGQGKVDAAGLASSVQLQLGDAQDLGGIPSGSVDKLTMSFGIRNVPDRPKALREIRRVMATHDTPSVADINLIGVGSEKEEKNAQGNSRNPPAGAGTGGGGTIEGSVVAILELQEPQTGFIAQLAKGFIKYVGPTLGKVISGSSAEYAHLTDSILAFPSPTKWEEMMEEAGLHVFDRQTMGFGSVYLYLARPL